MKFSFIDAEKADHSVRALCRVLGVSRSGYYAWKQRSPSAREREDQALAVHVRASHKSSSGTYGSPRVHKDLLRQGLNPSRKRVARLMAQQNLRGVMPRRWRTTTDSEHALALSPNRLERRFTACAPNRVWVADITYVHTHQGWLYVIAILDLYSRAVVGWAASDNLGTGLVLDAFRKAVRTRRPPAGLVFHSDRGRQFASQAFQAQLARHDMLGSMSRAGDCYDNAVAESFFGTLKRELIDRQTWSSRRSATDAISDYIDGFYNRRRLHSTLGYRTPDEVDKQYKAA